jgi:branched-chain amino acid transport system permease protein
MVAFATSAFVAGVGGAVIAYRQGGAFPSTFTYEQSLLFFAFAYLGGISRVGGALIGGLLISGGVVFVFGEEVLGIPPEFSLLLGGVGLVLTAVLNPEGIAGAMGNRLERLRQRRDMGGRSPGQPTSEPTEVVS